MTMSAEHMSKFAAFHGNGDVHMSEKFSSGTKKPQNKKKKTTKGHVPRVSDEDHMPIVHCMEKPQKADEEKETYYDRYSWGREGPL